MGVLMHTGTLMLRRLPLALPSPPRCRARAAPTARGRQQSCACNAASPLRRRHAAGHHPDRIRLAI